MKILMDTSLCNGCGACFNSCPSKAITMAKNIEGFLYPIINEDFCKECGICKKVCPLFKELNPSLNNVFALKHRNDEVRFHSASGGAFTLFSDFILQNNGVIYGVAFDKYFSPRFIRACSFQERDQMRGSKYVQANSHEIYPLVRLDLNNGKIVLFCGTPCQVSGLLNYLKRSYSNLITIDIICHGVMSPSIFSDYIKYITLRYGSFNFFTFRDKSIAWRGSHISLQIGNKSISETISLNVAKQLYYGHYSTRLSCHSCHFTSPNRISDITIGDFWGIEKSHPTFEDSLGVSLAIINTEKGNIIWDHCKSNCVYVNERLENCIQPQLYKPATPSPSRTQFWIDYSKYGFNRIAKTYGEAGLIAQTKRFIKKILFKFKEYT